MTAHRGNSEPSPAAAPGKSAAGLRAVGALAVLAIGAVHAYEYFTNYYNVIPIIGPLFVLNFASAVVIAVLLVVPAGRIADRAVSGSGPVVGGLVALGGIGLAVLSIAFLLASEYTRLFGFMESGYRLSIYVALAVEVVATVLLAGYLGLSGRRARS